MHANAKTIPEQLAAGYQQLVALGDFTTQVIGQSAIGERDVWALFQDGDVGVRIDAPRPRGGGGTTGHASDYHNLQLFRCHGDRIL